MTEHRGGGSRGGGRQGPGARGGGRGAGAAGGQPRGAAGQGRGAPKRDGDRGRAKPPPRGGERPAARDDDADDLALRQLRNKLSGVLRRLPDIERRVLELRMGLVDGNPHKPGEVASALGLTIPEVRKIEGRAFERIREVGPIKGLERFLER